MTPAGQRPQLTERQREILNYIERCALQVSRRIHLLAKRWVSARLMRAPASLEKTISSEFTHGYRLARPTRRRASRTLHNMVEVPILGRVTAGQQILAVENREGTMQLDPTLVKGTDTFALRIEGDSMIGAGILDGDYVLVRPQQSANNGDIVVALLEESVTVKRFYREADSFRLQPENPRLRPIYVPDVQICGKVVALIRPTVH
jgi:repressor LexA